MNNLIKSVILKQFAIDCDNSPNKMIDEIWNECKRKLILSGIDEKVLGELDFEEQILPSFEYRLLPNPIFWKKKLKQEFSFLIIEVESGNYQLLLNTLKELIPDVTYFVCYGEKDVIIRFMGNSSMVNRLEQVLLNYKIQSTVIPISDVLLFYDKKIPTDIKYQLPKFEKEEIDLLLSSNPTSIPKEKIEQMEADGLVLNSVLFEDTHKTGRIRALIGIKLGHIFSSAKMKEIESELGGLNNQEYNRRQSRPISSIYKCSNPFFAYLIEGIFDDQEQLDSITDSIQEIELISDTETIILAKALFAPLSFSGKMSSEFDEIAVMDSLVRENIMPLSQRFSEEFPDINKEYLNSTHEKLFLLLSIYNDLKVNINNYEFGQKSKVKEYLYKYFKGIINNKTSDIQDTGLGYVRDVVEKEHSSFVRMININILQNDPGIIQSTFGASNANWKKWGLFIWGRKCYPNWNANQIYGKIFQIPNEVLNDFEFLGISRNIFAHETDIDNTTKLIFTLKDVFLRSFRLLEWIEKSIPYVKNPMIPLQDINKIISKVNVDQMNNLSGIRFNQKEIKNLLIGFGKESSSQYDEIVKLLLDLQGGVGSFDEKIFTSIKEAIAPLIDKKDKDKAEKFVDFMKSVATSLPADIVSELLTLGILSFFGA